MATTLENRIAELERQHGRNGVKLILRADGETDDEARELAGLAGWPGVIIFMSEADTKL